MIESAVFLHTPSPVVAREVFARRVRDAVGRGAVAEGNVIAYHDGMNLAAVLPRGILPVRCAVTVLPGSFRDAGQLATVIDACAESPFPVMVFIAHSRALKCITSIGGALSTVDGRCGDVSGVSAVLGECGLSASDAVARRIAGSKEPAVVVGGILQSRESSSPEVTNRDVTAAEPDQEQFVWALSRAMFSGDVSQVRDVAGELSEGGVRPEAAAGYVVNQIRLAVAASGARGNTRPVLSRLGVSDRALYPVSRSLPSWDGDRVRAAEDAAAWLDSFMKSSAPSRMGAASKWDAVAAACAVVCSLCQPVAAPRGRRR